MQVGRVGEPSAMITFIGSWKDPEAWLQDLAIDEVDVVDYDARKIRILVPTDQVKATLEQMAKDAHWLVNA